METIIKTHGDLIYDLCESILKNSVNSQLSFRKILQTIKRSRKTEQYVKYERAWILKIAVTQLRKTAGRYVRQKSKDQVDPGQGASQRLKNFPLFFHRITIEDQILLILKDKYGIPYSEIAAALAVPEATLKVRRQYALRALEEWVWEP
jgi:DNA-directed RNA polymerase specialized sigma24 family protein